MIDLMTEKSPDVYNPTLRHYLTILPLYLFIRLLQLTVRIKTSERTAKILSSPENFIGVAWHSRILYLPFAKSIFRPTLPMTGLVSASKDGAYLCAIFNLMKILTVRGSHKRRGANSIIELINAVKNGSDVFITPDGPKGPMNKAKAGFVVVSKESNARIVAVKITPNRCWRISKAWDKFIIPKPFSSATFDVLEYKNFDELEKQSQETGKKPEEIITEFLNSDNID